MSSTKAARFAEGRDLAYGAAHDMGSDRLQTLWVLASAREMPDFEFLTPAEVADILRDAQGIHLPRQRVTAILAKENGTVSRKRVKGKNQYKIMKAGLDLLQPATQSAILVDPENALTHIRKFEEVLASLSGDLRVCDPYVENRTLDLLSECRSARSISLLTANILKESTLRRDLAAYEKGSFPSLEIRIANKTVLHDRYILHDEGMLLLGTSLNGFAKKQSFIVPLGPDIAQATGQAFGKVWSVSSKFA